jgi:hypothetical protein
MLYFILSLILLSFTNVNTLVPIGGNLDILIFGGRSQPYVNLIKQSYTWGNASSPGQPITSVDPATGWPTSDFGVMISSSAVDLGGAYILSAKGNANVSVFDNRLAYITNKTYDSLTNTLTAIVNIPEGATQITLSFTNTTGPGLQDVVLLQPGYNLTSNLMITNLLLTHLSRFSLLRFMEWIRTNTNFETNWNDTTPLNWPQYFLPKHNPWPTIPYITNQINKSIDIWINMPHNATDDYILHVARLMLNELNSKSNIYVEFSNEVWNGVFPQYHANVFAANDSVLNHGDPYHFNYDNCSNVFIWAPRRTAYQIKRISDLFKIVFGEENVGPWKRIRPLLAGQTGYPTLIMLGLDYLNRNFGPPSAYLHGIAIAPYFDLGEYRTWPNVTTEQVLDGLNSSVQKILPEQGWTYNATVGIHAVYAAWYNLSVYGYEGGPDTAYGCSNCSFEAKRNATRHPRMTDICITYLNGWYRYGFQTLNWFTAGASEVDKWGSWGLLEDMRQETLMDTTTMFNATSPVAQLPRPSPKLKAMDQVRQSTIEMNFGIPIPALNISATKYMHHYVPDPYPDVRYPVKNSTFYYPLQVHQSPIQINVTVYVGGKSGLLEGALNNGQFVQVETPNTTNRTTYHAAPSMQFNINQNKLPSIVVFRLRNIDDGYAIRSFDVVLLTKK